MRVESDTCEGAGKANWCPEEATEDQVLALDSGRDGATMAHDAIEQWSQDWVKHTLLTAEQIVAAGMSLPDRGIYFLIQQGKVVYVGQTTCLVQRLAEHKRTKKFDGFALIPCPADKLDTLDALYRKARKQAGVVGLNFHDSRRPARTASVPTPWQSGGRE